MVIVCPYFYSQVLMLERKIKLVALLSPATSLPPSTFSGLGNHWRVNKTCNRACSGPPNGPIYQVNRIKSWSQTLKRT